MGICFIYIHGWNGKTGVWIYVHIYIYPWLYVCMDTSGRMYGSMGLNGSAIYYRGCGLIGMDGYGCNLCLYACTGIWIGVQGIDIIDVYITIDARRVML
jgi:hypothetical protein